jgi:predicted aspartyl protease
VRSKGKAWSVPIKVNGFEISAIVDTAAESTLISNRLYESLIPKPEVKGSVKLKTADSKFMSANVLEPLTLQVGELEVEFEVLKGDEMLFGMDFLREVDVSLECGRGTLTIGGQRIPLQVSASVLAVRRTVIPPNSVRLLESELSKECSS